MPKLREPPKQEEEKPKPVTTAGQSGFVEPQEPEVVVAQRDDAAEEFKKQIETLRRSEQTARDQAAQASRERDAALQQAQQRQLELNRSHKDVADSRLEAIQSGIAAAEAEIEEAKKAFRMAGIEQDGEAQIAAQERLAEAAANKVNLINGKAAFEQQIKEAEQRAQYQQQLAQQQRQQQAQQGDQLDRTNLPDTAKKWLRAHPDYLQDSRKNAKIQSLHWDVLDEGHPAFSDAYYESLEQHLGLRERPRQKVAVEEQDDDESERRPIVSAPVSREVPSGDRRPRNASEVRLTQAQREMAKAAGVSEADYAKGLIRLQQEKANGNYGGAP